MREFTGVKITLRKRFRGELQVVAFIPGPSDLEISGFVAAPDITGHWLNVHAVARRDGGFLACRFATGAVLCVEPIK
jgi:hypothetical protein